MNLGVTTSEGAAEAQEPPGVNVIVTAPFPVTVAGVTVIPASMDSPRMVVSHLVSPDVKEPDMARADMEQPGPGEPHMQRLSARNRARRPKPDRSRHHRQRGEKIGTPHHSRDRIR